MVLALEWLTLVLIGLAFVLCFIRLLLGPTAADRVLAAETLALGAVGLLVVHQCLPQIRSQRILHGNPVRNRARSRPPGPYRDTCPTPRRPKRRIVHKRPPHRASNHSHEVRISKSALPGKKRYSRGQQSAWRPANRTTRIDRNYRDGTR